MDGGDAADLRRIQRGERLGDWTAVILLIEIFFFFLDLTVFGDGRVDRGHRVCRLS